MSSMEKINDIHVHLGPSSVINQKLLDDDLLKFRENYGINHIDKVCNTLNNDYSILKKKTDDIKEVDIKNLPVTDNYKCYSYLCKTNDKETKIEYKLGKLHYSNFF